MDDEFAVFVEPEVVSLIFAHLHTDDAATFTVNDQLNLQGVPLFLA